MKEDATTNIRYPESPKRFFQILRERAWYHHQLLAKHVAEAGFVVRRVVKQANHANVWGLYLRRGTVPAGQEFDTVKHTVSAMLRGLGVKCPRNEIQAMSKADGIEAFFIYPRGTPGILSFYQGRMEWLPDPLQVCLESEE